MKNTTVISAFPACGKSYIYNNETKSDKIILDSDSSEFSWIKDSNGNNTKERNPNFPKNYMEHIKENIGKVDIIFVSSHDVVRDALKEKDIKYTLVYPHITLKDTWVERFRLRGNDENFINFISSNWNSFIEAMEDETFPNKIILYEGYLSDVIELLTKLSKIECSDSNTYRV